MINNKLSYGVISMLLIYSFNAHAYTIAPKQVTKNIYAIVGPIDQRTKDNYGLNNNLGFIITPKGVILIDTGASKFAAQKLESAIKKVTHKPIKWVINTGSQDHRWLGNGYFASKGAKIIALERTAETQNLYSKQQLNSLKRFVGNQLKGTIALPATSPLKKNDTAIELGGIKLVLHYTNAHYPGDAWVWLPTQKVIFTGDLVYVDRLLAVLPWSSVQSGQKAFHEMVALKPKFIVPGHGHVTDLATAKKDTGDYYDFLANTIGAAAMQMQSMDEVIINYALLPRFAHLKHFNELHRTNINRTFLEFERL